MLLKFIGKDSGFGEKNNSAYIETDNKLILIDCGFTVFNEIKNKFDFHKYDEIDVIITHLHNDHAGSLSQLILYLYFVFNKKVNVYSKCENIKEYLKITGTPLEAFTLYSNTENLKFIKTEHVDYIDAYGFALNIANTKIVYTGDTKTLKPFLPYLNKANEFYVDVSKNGGAHLRIDDVLEKLTQIQNNGIEVILMHIDDKEYINKITSGAFII